MLFYLLPLVLFYIIIRIELKRRKIERDFSHIPTPKEVTGIGNLLAISKNSITDAQELLEKICPTPVNKLTFAGYLAFTTYDPEIVKQLLLSPSVVDRPYFFDFLQLEYGLVGAHHEHWKPVRQSLNRVFNHSSVMTMLDKFNQHTNALVKKFTYFKGERCDLLNVCLRYTLEQTFDTMLQTEFSASDNDAIMILELNEVACIRSFYLLYHFDVIFQHTSLHRRMEAWHSHFENILKPIIAQKKKLGDVSVEGDYKPSFITELVKTCFYEEKFPMRTLMDNLKTILVAGSEPLGIALANVLTMLAIHPEIDKKVYAEIRDLYHDDKSLNSETVKKFTYLDMVCKETLRFIPVIPGTLRDTIDDTYIDGIGLIPKGTKIGIVNSKLHHDPNIWGPSCDKFDPDHFLPEKVATRHPYSFLPFSGGARNCIGHHFAHLTLRMALIKVLSKYRFTTDLKMEDLSLKFCLIMRVANKVMVQVHKR